MVAATEGRWAWPPVPVDIQMGTSSRPERSWMPWPGPVALVFVFFLVIRQNRKDFEEIEAWLAEERLNS